MLSETPDLIVATPSRALSLLQAKVCIRSMSNTRSLTSTQTISLQSIDTLVIDEADLILSYGHDSDIRAILAGGYLPKLYQSFLMSATMTEDVEVLKGLTLRNPVNMTLRRDW
jgi:ATP-dependent RNA helicase DDX56/DBP9